MAQHVVARRKSHPVRNVLLALLLMVLVYVACAGFSLYHIYEDAQTAQATYQQLQQAISSGQTSDVLDDTRSLCSTAADLNDQASMWVWMVGEHIPWIGEDITVGRGLASVSDTLCNDVVLPIVEQYEGVTSGTATVTTAADALASAQSAASSCSNQLSSLGTSHFSQLNDAKASLSQAVEVASASLGSVSGIISALGSLGNMVSLAG